MTDETGLPGVPGRTVDTPHGPGLLQVVDADEPVALLLLSHGAGAGVDTRDLAALAELLPPQGFSVALFTQPWRVAGRKVATPPATLDAGLAAAAAAVAESHAGVPLVLGGRSAGARSACRSARDLGAVGVLALSFPLHPPGKPERSRLPELSDVGVPVLVVQGERDTMGRPEEYPDPMPDGVEMGVLPGADHGLKVGARAEPGQDDVLAMLVETTLEWLVREVVGGSV
ncbi:alpha/beta hydrolase family protein [Nocardioides bruguierae]|uniref:Hydrolase n=1 Tax=Nocardioides bruguierae TaxID=2945102 RepID=A0A9X2D585_9ACTN|nr:alpha/beta family hydrolase [Nocardioides bruguierae]MCL8024829.1 hydrolase [Nocardioides bruguierae]MCM0619234.1 hydrolase [Nocardioides bruguierae]